VRKLKAVVEILSEDEIALVHKGSLRILEDIGFALPNDECLGICEQMGAVVDRERSIVKIPSYLIEELLSKIKDSKNVKPEINTVPRLTGKISTQASIIDYPNRTRRYGTLNDVIKGIAVVEHLDNIPKSNSIVVPYDVPSNMTDLLSFYTIYKYSSKPGGTYILTPISAKYIIQMAKLMGTDVEYLVESVSPLSFRKETLEIALIFAKNNQPLRMAPMVMAGATGPASIAGTLTLQNSEVLISLFLIYALTSEFTDYVVGGHTIDYRTMTISFGSPNQALIGIGTAQLARFYGLNSSSNSGLTDSLEVDFQSGFEKASSAIFSCMAGTKEIGCVGIIGADQGISLELLTLDNEWLSAYNYIIGGIEVNEATIGIDVIENVGIGGHFASENHTVQYMRDNFWPSRLFNRDPWGSAVLKNNRLLDKTHEFVEECIELSRNKGPVIEQNILSELDRIIKAAEEEVLKKQ